MATKEGDALIVRHGLAFKRYFTSEDRHPFDDVEWEVRDALIPNFKEGGNAFEQRGVEFPKSWSQNATNIVAQKYFRGPLGTPQRESSVRQLVSRVVDTIRGWGEKNGYFDSPHDAEVFADELTHLVVTQKAAFNSPVWFNVGVPGTPQQCSACFILAVDDTMSSILNWYVEEGTIFKGGSGSGINLSRIRSSKESLAGGGTASGPVSFMRGADASAGTIKSGGKTRRAAKMVVLDADHPDVRDFIWCKAVEERKARALRDAGFDMDLDGRDSYSIQYQNANNSVRVTDEFMHAYEQDRDWRLKAVTTGETLDTVRARELMREIAQAAWECADPGMQYDTTINEWHTCPATGRINASNPCCFVGETLIETDREPVSLEILVKRASAGEVLPRARCFDPSTGRATLERITNAWVAGHVESLVELTTTRGLSLRCTPEHRFLTSRGYVQARELKTSDRLVAVRDEQVVTDLVASLTEVRTDASTPVYDIEVEGVHNFAVSSEGDVQHAVVVHNSEYMHLDNSACNLASLNLLQFLDEDGNFDVASFRHAVEIVFTAQEIIVGEADYPTEKIGQNARAFRQLGLGYANLGALLMARGLPYDSDAGRAWAGALTALMTGWAYRTSAKIAEAMGPFEGYRPNADAMLRVMAKHRAAVDEVDGDLIPEGLLSAARHSWDEAVGLGRRHGYRNAQASVLAPTGTIALLLDCDTTGIEPELALVKTKKLVGGGTMQFVNQTVPRALERLGYAREEIDDVVAYIAEHNSVAGAPHVKDDHLAVFDCSFKPAKGTRSIAYMGHLKMMAAAQPFISGAISKTVNIPEHVTVEDVERLFVESWKLGLKAVAIYRDNCKVAQPLSADKKKGVPEPAQLAQPVRKRLPRSRPSVTTKFEVGDAEGYITASSYPDNGIGEIFLKTSKQGSTLAGIMDAFSIAISIGLQYGVPLEAYVEKFINMKFEPSGVTNDPDIRFATSLVDYVFRRLALDHLPREGREAIGIRSIEERKAAIETSMSPAESMVETPIAEADAQTGPRPSAKELDAPLCYNCGSRMQPAGSCYVCASCGSTSGCS